MSDSGDLKFDLVYKLSRYIFCSLVTSEIDYFYVKLFLLVVEASIP